MRIKARRMAEELKKKEALVKKVEKPKPKPKKVVKKKIKVKKDKPKLFRDKNPVVDMEGNFLPPEFRYNQPSYDLASGRYINQPSSDVKCFTLRNKAKKPYTTCINTQYNQQLRRGKPPNTKQRKINKPPVSVLRKQKKELKPINREPDLNYTLL